LNSLEQQALHPSDYTSISCQDIKLYQTWPILENPTQTNHYNQMPLNLIVLIFQWPLLHRVRHGQRPRGLRHRQVEGPPLRLPALT
jgi:hypothetical protein